MIDVIRLALEALEYHQELTRPIHKTQETITALRQAIEQAEKPTRNAADFLAEKQGAFRDPRVLIMEFYKPEQEQWDTSDMAHRSGGLAIDMSTKQEKIDTSEERVHETDKSIHETPDDLLRQSEREGWRYAKECEAEVKRLTELNRQLVAAAKELGAADDVHEWDDAWAKMAKLMRQGEINATSSQDGR
jgi:hypothetical protein